MNRQLTLFTEDFLAEVSRSVWPETREQKKTAGIYGQSFRAWSEKLNRVGLLLKTYLELSSSQQIEFVPTWSVKVTALGFGILKLFLSAHHTEENEYFLWRTPDAHCDRGFRKRETFENRQKRGMPMQLNDQVAHIAKTPIEGGVLNPEWVCWLMGFPAGWTEVD